MPGFPRHSTRESRTLCRWSPWSDLDRGGSDGQEAHQEAQAAAQKAQAAWWATRWPDTQWAVSSARCDVYSWTVPPLLRGSAMRSDGRERHRRDLLLRAGGDVLHLCRILLLRHLRLPRRRRHVRSLPGTNLQRRTAVLRRRDLQQRVLRWLPGPRCLLYRGFAMLLQHLHRRRLPVGARGAVRARRRLPRLLPRPELHRRLRERQLHDLERRRGLGSPRGTATASCGCTRDLVLLRHTHAKAGTAYVVPPSRQQNSAIWALCSRLWPYDMYAIRSSRSYSAPYQGRMPACRRCSRGIRASIAAARWWA